MRAEDVLKWVGFPERERTMIVIMVGIVIAIPLAFVHREAAWFTLAIFGLYGIGDELTRIQSFLVKLFVFSEWFRVLESHRFSKQYPNAAAEWEADREAEREAARKTEGPVAATSGPSVFRADVQPEYPTQPSSVSGSKNPKSR